MKVAVLGAGALGSVYGVRLARRGGVDVTFVVRTPRAGDPSIAIERIRRRGSEREVAEAPTYATAVPADADAIVVAVGVEDLGGALADGGAEGAPAKGAAAGPLGSSSTPIVILTPMLPKVWARVRAAFGDRVYAGMPNIAAYTRKEDRVVRYWMLPAATKIDEPRAGASDVVAVRALAGALSRAGMRARFELGVHETNPATTVSFVAIGMAIAVAGSVDALVRDEPLLDLVSRACREGLRLSGRIGTPEPFTWLAPAVSAPWALRAGFGALGKISKEAIFYAEEHFGRKLLEQHRLMAGQMAELAAEANLPHAAIDALAERLGTLAR